MLDFKCRGRQKVVGGRDVEVPFAFRVYAADFNGDFALYGFTSGCVGSERKSGRYVQVDPIAGIGEENHGAANRVRIGVHHDGLVGVCDHDDIHDGGVI